MNINFIINLNDKEKELMVKQCVKEFKHAVRVAEACEEEAHKAIHVPEHKMRFVPGLGLVHFRKDPSTLACERDKAFDEGAKRLISLISNSNVSRLRAIAIVDIAEAFNLPIDSTTFNEMVAYRGCLTKPKEDKPYYRKLAIYMMCRAGVITKGTRDRMLQLLKTKTPIQLQKRTQRKVNKLHEAFVEFNRKINAIVSRDEAKEIAKECGLHRYMVKKYGIEAVTSACCGTTEYTEPCGI
jgi:hypothetical protein